MDGLDKIERDVAELKVAVETIQGDGDTTSLRTLAEEVDRANNLALLCIAVFEEMVAAGQIPREIMRLAAKKIAASRLVEALSTSGKQVHLSELLPEVPRQTGVDKKTQRRLGRLLREIEELQSTTFKFFD